MSESITVTVEKRLIAGEPHLVVTEFREEIPDHCHVIPLRSVIAYESARPLNAPAGLENSWTSIVFGINLSNRILVKMSLPKFLRALDSSTDPRTRTVNKRP